MDNRNRLTKWEEWREGAHYEWVKGNSVLGNYVCVEVNKKDGHVRMQSVGGGDIVRNFEWKNRYRERSACPKANE